MSIPVEQHVLNGGIHARYEKVRSVIEGRKPKYQTYTRYELADHIMKINEKYGDQITEQSGLRAIIDW